MSHCDLETDTPLSAASTQSQEPAHTNTHSHSHTNAKGPSKELGERTVGGGCCGHDMEQKHWEGIGITPLLRGSQRAPSDYKDTAPEQYVNYCTERL